MFLYFPDNYMWSLAFMRALWSGAILGELHRIGQRLAPLQTVAPTGDLEAWHNEWYGLAEQLETRAHEALASAHRATAHDNFYRATIYYQWAEAFLPPDDARKAYNNQQQSNAVAGAGRDRLVQLARKQRVQHALGAER